MSPFIKDNDIVTISPLKDSSIKLGNPVAFIHPQSEGLAIHRIVGRRHGDYLIKADNSFMIDCLVPLKNILGIVTRVGRNG